MLVFNQVLFGALATVFTKPNVTKYQNSCPPDFFLTTPKLCMGFENDQCEYHGGVNGDGYCVIEKNVLPTPLVNQTTPKNLIVWEDGSEGFRRLNYSENLHLQSTCGVAKYVTERVFNGRVASPGQFPWSLNLYMNGAMRCSAVLISQRHVLTAKHCLNSCESYDSMLKDIEIKYGGVCLENGPNCPKGSDLKTVKVRRVVFPDRVVPGCMAYTDIAMLELENDIILDEKTNPICIGNFETKNMINIQASGYGDTALHKGTDILRYMHAEILNKDNVYEIITRGLKPFNDSLINSDICPGDSGSALQATYKGSDRAYAVGILSRSGGDCRVIPRNALYTFLPVIADWICKETGVCEL